MASPATPGAGSSPEAATHDPNEVAIATVGRTQPAAAAGDALLRLGWPGVALGFRFRGTGLTLTMSEVVGHYSGAEGPQCFDVIVDGTRSPSPLEVSGRAPTAQPVATGLGDGEHTVWLVKRTEGIAGSVKVQAAGLDPGGSWLQAPAGKARRLMLLGASSDTGYGVESLNCHGYDSRLQNQNKAWGQLAADALGADLHNISYSGKGMTTNYNPPEDVLTLPQSWLLVDPNVSDQVWDVAHYVPDVVVINAGRNDFENVVGTQVDPDNFVATYGQLIDTILKSAPDAHVYGMINAIIEPEHREKLIPLVRNAVAAQTAKGNQRVHYVELPAYTGSDYACDGHPSAALHQQMAQQMTATIKKRPRVVALLADARGCRQPPRGKSSAANLCDGLHPCNFSRAALEEGPKIFQEITMQNVSSLSASNRVGFARVDDDTFHHVLDRLDAADLLRCARVSRAWRGAVDSSPRWDELAATNEGGRDHSLPAKEAVRQAFLAGINAKRGCFRRCVLHKPREELADIQTRFSSTSVTWSPNMRYLVAWWADATVKILDAEKGGTVFQAVPNEDDNSEAARTGYCSSWRDDSSQVILAHDHGRVIAVDSTTWSPMLLLHLDEPLGGIQWLPGQNRVAVDLSPSELIVCTLGANGGEPVVSRNLLADIDLTDEDDSLENWYGLSPDTKKVASLTVRGSWSTLRLVETETGRDQRGYSWETAGPSTTGLGWSPDSTRFAVHQEACAIHVFDLGSDSLSATRYNWPRTYVRPKADVRAPVWSPNGERMIVKVSEQFYIFRSTGGDPLVAIEGNGPTYYCLMQWKANSKEVVLSSNTVAARIVDAQTGRISHHIQGPVRSSWMGEFNNTAEQLTLRDEAYGIYILSLDTSEITLLSETANANSFNWSKDHTRLAVLSNDGAIAVLDFRPRRSSQR